MNEIKEKFILSLNLKNFSEKPAGFNFECPFCNEGHSIGKKTRSWLLKNRDYQFFCHNEQLGKTFKNFLRELDGTLYERYLEEIKQDKLTIHKKRIEKNLIPSKDRLIKYRWNFDSTIFKPLTKSAIEYLEKRKIPKKYYKELKYVKEYKHFRDMIIFPLINNKKGIYGFQGRGLTEKVFKTWSPPDNPKIWNYFNIDNDIPVKITESIIDAMFIKNSISMMGSDIGQEYLCKIKSPIFVFDNDATGMKKTKRYLNKGFKVFIYPSELDRFKDLNEIVVRGGYSVKKLNHLIDSNIYEGSKGKSYLLLKTSKRKYK